jgi:L-fuconolactonase
MVQGREAGWYDQPQLDPALVLMSDKGMTLDALVREVHLPSLERLARRFPRLAIVIDHAAKPRIGADGGFEDWYDAIAPLADRPNVHCKLSGLLTECPPGEADEASLAPYVPVLLDLFGAERLMWGSDWPVLNMAGDYAGWLAMARSLVPREAHRAVFRDTAAAFYGFTGSRA